MPVAQIQYLGEELGDFVSQARDEGGDGGEVGSAISGQGDEGDVFAAGALDAPAADDAPAVGKENDLEQHPRRVGAGAGEIVLVAAVKAPEIDFVVDDPVQCVFEAARQELPLQIHGEEPRVGINVLVAGHAALPLLVPLRLLVIPFGSQQNATMKRIFLQLR